MNPYNHKTIESKWRDYWNQNNVYKTLTASEAVSAGKKPYYVLDMFPYPSGAGLHVGHPRGYIASDVLARMKRMQGYNVLHPMGFDSFGLPAEQYAIQTGENPAVFTEELVKKYKQQLEDLGFSYDWDREVATHRPEYYRWTQWIFLQIYNSWYDTTQNKARPISELIEIFESGGAEVLSFGEDLGEVCANWKNLSPLEKQNILMSYRLAYEGYAEVNWCEELGTVLANDEIVDDENGNPVSERGGYPVTKKPMRQWFMRITVYADRLLAGLETIDWSDSIKEIQRNWIGKSEGSEITFYIENVEHGYFVNNVDVFTTRADTLYGVTYIALSIDHPVVENLLKHQIKNWDKVSEYIQEVKKQDRNNIKEITGIKLEGIIAKQSFLDDFEVPVYITNYVIGTYGTGAVMGVPAHDERDFEFADKYNLPIKSTISPIDIYRGIVVSTTVIDSELFKNKLKENEIKYEIAISKISGREQIRFEIDSKKIKTIIELIQENITEGNWVEILGTQSILVTKDSVNIDYMDNQQEWFDKMNQKEKFLDGQKNFWHLLFKNDFLRPFVCFTDEGVLVNSNQFNGLTSEQARKAITELVDGKLITKYNIRDAIFARQRYWGEPIPLIHTTKRVPYFIDPDFPPKKEFGESVHRNNVSIVLTNKNNQVLLLKWKKFPWVSFIGGGIENNENVIDSGIREVVEETGYKNINFIKQFEQSIHVESSADHKKQNRYANITLLHCELVDEEVVDINKEESDSFDLLWVEKDKVSETITGPEAKALWEIFNTETVVTCDKWINVNSGIITEIPETSLPLTLPLVDSYAPAGDGQSPLATVPAWVSAGYETNTMPGWAGSSWYFLRYIDPHNNTAFASNEELDYWFGNHGGVNTYIGGTEHATGHLLYSRFWHKVLHDLGYVKTDEPFMSLRNQGMILAEDGRKMSKRWGNVINPDDMVERFGADTMRVYEMFMGPFTASQPWSTDGMVGSRRFIERVWRISESLSDITSPDLEKVLHKTIKKVSDDIVNFSLNTAVSAMMILVNEIEKQDNQISEADYKKFLQILAPFAPHITEEIWQTLGERGSIHLSPWPTYDPALVVDDTITLGIQVNGKVRAEIEIGINETQDSVQERVLALPEIQKWTDGQEIKKFIYIPNKIISIVS